MTVAGMSFYAVVFGIILYRIIFKRKMPSNKYTPYDDITMGRQIDVMKDQPIYDTKHEIEYKEETRNENEPKY
ncbi:hypothetical protein M3196_13215 [Fictibacillus nanhaiensis]|jgi:hypothetical protein|uniref:hypothetical protein n=1 Tax=Fictibacillus nanhaiensis TaxID=742169 RepID=UPI00204094AA|nr:hypothetical protein [Fictibacillus nanhaiensis]MCM3732626.1 hypothetical protein [Fictibacillus nanhaiensis]